MKNKRTAYIALTMALAMILSYAETLLPVLVAIPGIKAGLANIAVIFALYKFSLKEAIGISLLRIFIIAVLFGSTVSLAYSIAGGALSLLCMYLLKKTKIFSTVSVSVVGGVTHNIGQIIVACIIMDTSLIAYYFPILLVSGIISGIIVGLLASIVIKRIKL